MYKVFVFNAENGLQGRYVLSLSIALSLSLYLSLSLSLSPQFISFHSLDVCYNIALCYYKMKQFAGALKYITEIIERGIKEHPGVLNITIIVESDE